MCPLVCYSGWNLIESAPSRCGSDQSLRAATEIDSERGPCWVAVRPAVMRRVGTEDEVGQVLAQEKAMQSSSQKDCSAIFEQARSWCG